MVKFRFRWWRKWVNDLNKTQDSGGDPLITKHHEMDSPSFTIFDRFWPHAPFSWPAAPPLFLPDRTHLARNRRGRCPVGLVSLSVDFVFLPFPGYFRSFLWWIPATSDGFWWTEMSWRSKCRFWGPWKAIERSGKRTKLPERPRSSDLKTGLPLWHIK